MKISLIRYLRAAVVCVAISLTGPVLGEILFHDGFEEPPPGDPPGLAVNGTHQVGGVIFVGEGGYRVGDVVGPEAARTGRNLLVVDRKNHGGNDMLFVFEKGLTLNDVDDLSIQFFIFGEPLISGSFGLTNGSGFNAATIVTWNNISVASGALWMVWNDGSWVGYDISGDWRTGEWNKINVFYDAATGLLTGTVNDNESGTVNNGDPIPLLTWGGFDVLIDRLRFRGGSGPSAYFLDDVAVIINGTGFPDPQPPIPLPPPLPPLEGPVFADGFETATVDAAPPTDFGGLGRYNATGSFITVLSGPDPVNGDSPESAASGANHLGLDDRFGGIGDPQLAAILASDPKSFVASSTELQATFWIWIAASPDSLASFAIGTSGQRRENSQLIHTAIGGDPIAWSYWNGSEFIPTGLTIPDRTWTKLTVKWDGSQAWGSVNDGDALEIGLFGTPDNKISRLIFGRVEGSTEASYYLDEIDVELFSIAPPPPPEISVSADGNNIVLDWSGGALQWAPDAQGPYEDVDGASSPMTIATDRPRAFYRVRSE